MENNLIDVVEMVVKSVAARHISVIVLVEASAVVLAHSYTNYKNRSVGGYAAVGIFALAGLVVAHAINSSFDAILEEHEESIFRDYNQAMKVMRS